METADQNLKSLHPQLAAIIEEIDAASKKAQMVAGNLDIEQLEKRPAPDQWSIAECLVHLNMTNREFLAIFDEVLTQTAKGPGVTDRKYKMDLLGRFLKWTLEPPPISIFKTKTTERFQPTNIESVGDVLSDFLNLQKQLEMRVANADGLPLDQIKVSSPFGDKIKYNLLVCFSILTAHERRHLWQAEQAKNII